MRLGEWDCKVFCQKHSKIGKKKIEKLKDRRSQMRQRKLRNSALPKEWAKGVVESDDQALDDNEDELGTRKTRSSYTRDPIRKINIDRLIQENFEENAKSKIVSKTKIDYDRFNEIVDRTLKRKQDAVFKGKHNPKPV